MESELHRLIDKNGGFTPEEEITFMQKMPAQIREALKRRLMMDHIEPLRQKLERALEHLDPDTPHVGGAPLPTIAQVMDWFYPGCPESVAFLFIRTCQTYGLSPYRRQIQLIPKRKNIAARNEPKEYVNIWPMVIDYRVYISYAKKDPRYDYFNAELIFPGKDKSKPATGAFIDIFMKGKDKPFHWEVNAREIEQSGDMWKEGSAGGKRNHMILKTVIKQGHELFAPEFLAGLSSVDGGLTDLSGREAEEVDKILDPPAREPIGGPVDRGFFGDEEKPKAKSKPAAEKAPAQEEGVVTKSLKERIKEMLQGEDISGDQYRGLRETALKVLDEDPEKAVLLQWIGQLERAIGFQRDQKKKADSDPASNHLRDSDPKQNGEKDDQGGLPF